MLAGRALKRVMSTDAPLTVDADQLPNDVGVLKSLVVQLIESLRQRDARIAQLERHMDLLVRKVYGRTSERLDPRQLPLFETQAVDEEVPLMAECQPEPSTTAVSTTVSKPRGRRPKPDTLERHVIIYDLSEAEKQALAGDGSLVLIGEEITEQYEWEPSCLYVLRHVQKKYARRPALVESGVTRIEKNIVMAPKPPQPISGGTAGPGLLAYLITSRFCDHLPYHRQERIFARHGLRFSRQTTCDWARQLAELCRRKRPVEPVGSVRR
jgi:transposase